MGGENGDSRRLAGLERITAPLYRLVESMAFEYCVIAVILANAVLLGLGTFPRIEGDYGDWLHLGNRVVLGIFVAEAALKMLALAPRSYRYFRLRLEHLRLCGYRLFLRPGHRRVRHGLPPRQAAASRAAHHDDQGAAGHRLGAGEGPFPAWVM